mmetsp:Transcript_2835/g.10291  ORF Transcript_2835/g.10291 Transcript_2835/m.10291 type:complete len:232 (+) Transcript_2835:1315-2010(+)
MESYKPAADIPSRSSTLALLRTITRALGPNLDEIVSMALSEGLRERIKFWMLSHNFFVRAASDAHSGDSSSTIKDSRCSSLPIFAHANSMAPNGRTAPLGAKNCVSPADFSAMALKCAHIADLVPAIRVEASVPIACKSTRSMTVVALDKSASNSCLRTLEVDVVDGDVFDVLPASSVCSSVIPVDSAQSFTDPWFINERAYSTSLSSSTAIKGTCACRARSAKWLKCGNA